MSHDPRHQSGRDSRPHSEVLRAIKANNKSQTLIRQELELAGAGAGVLTTMGLGGSTRAAAAAGVIGYVGGNLLYDRARTLANSRTTMPSAASFGLGPDPARQRREQQEREAAAAAADEEHRRQQVELDKRRREAAKEARRQKQQHQSRSSRN